MISPFHERRSKACRNSSGAAGLTTILRSKSVPLPKLRYSCVGRA